MKQIYLGTPALLKFEGPDTVRFLNGQVTQDVGKIVLSDKAMPACVTDHKGKLQFRVWLHARDEAVLVEAPEDLKEDLEARLTRYLIADDVEVEDLSGQWQLHHLTDFIGEEVDLGNTITKGSARMGSDGLDVWLPAGEANPLTGIPVLEGDALEALRIERGIPAWGRELTKGILPPEAGLEATDISYTKGCYIGQEVISRIKSAGKVPRRMVQLSFNEAIHTQGLELEGGTLTSISPLPQGGKRIALAYLKRGVEAPKLRDSVGVKHEAVVRASL